MSIIHQVIAIRYNSMRYIFLFSLITIVYGSLNVYDTYNADKCQRIRRPWHKLTSEEKDLYISGLLQLRKNGNGNMNDDELISIGSVHEDPTAFLHQTSSYLYWHGYLVWELESRIRNLGGKWQCFGMPYWDFTLESGREQHPQIFEHGEIGGDGDPNNYWTVNGYSWYPSIQDYWVPNNCIGKDDTYPFCSLKRALRDGFSMPSAKDIGDVIMNNPNFEDFAEYSHVSGSAIHLIDAHPDDMDGFPQAYEPIWYLFHSGIQFHQALWTDCNEYDLININELEKYPNAFTSFCNSYNDCADDKGSNGYGMSWGLDDKMYFGGLLQDKQWSYIHKNWLTVRKLYMIPQWNIIYDLDNGQGFYYDSGLGDYCKGKLNNQWFIVDKLNGEINEERVNNVNGWNIRYLRFANVNAYLVVLFGFVAVMLVVYIYPMCQKKKAIVGEMYDSSNVYGSV